MVTETGLNADPGIVEGDRMATEEFQQTRTHGSREAPERFGCRKHRGESGDRFEKIPQLGIVKMVKEKIAEDEFAWRDGGEPLAKIGWNDRGQPVLAAKEFEGGIGDAGLAVHKKETAAMAAVWESLGQQEGEEMSVAATQVGQAGRGAIRESFLKPTKPVAGLAEKRVEALKIAPAGQGGGVGGGKGVENFGGEAADAHERTSRWAP
ncbi:MAG: hypothetical protein EBQ51_09050 [Verrucomicrobia bacterium]|nr:hypothetical protein [Pseudomonadota bacterium]NBS06507.1 hypothetical protein [Verrucomicrobiota bacterium]NBS49785.1 hypothetical protein [Verrucomicrobiota bacterium]NBS79312.1 hypothetical protein [bacterium]NBY67200.1 hypothetical protein [Verrucomicrobiota bacterium]